MYSEFSRNSSDGGKIGAGSRVRLACKRVFVPIFTSDGHPMLLNRPFSVKKMSRPEQLRIGYEKAEMRLRHLRLFDLRGGLRAAREEAWLRVSQYFNNE